VDFHNEVFPINKNFKPNYQLFGKKENNNKVYRHQEQEKCPEDPSQIG